MGSIPENRKHWGETYAWSAGGEEWSESWGGSAAQWRFTLAPRLARFLPASRIVEIGCGHGRWTHYLRERCDEVIALDLVDSCVAACRERFGDDPRVVCRSTDGLSLTGVEDASVDLVFSFDSLVHAELDTLERYLVEMARCLRPGGAAFLHHSNFGEILALRPGSWNHHWRAESVSAELFAERCEAVRLRCVTQEIVDWGGIEDCDVLSVAVPVASAPQEERRVERNRWFMGEAYSLRVRSLLWGDPEA
ncbi:MAG: class I SAM-dependent methyltransferase [Acidobacteria bacterium]|nr:class I SAM-dependent methyltransferase [Acidobacteriota bacterium]